MREWKGLLGPYENKMLPIPIHGPKDVGGVYNDIFQLRQELQWQWPSFLNSNGVFQKRRNYNGTDLINPTYNV